MKKKRVSEQETAIVDRFVHAFVIDAKRDRARRLLLGNSEQRIEAIQRMPAWLEPALRVAGSASRFGKLAGQLLDDKGMSHVAIDEAQAFANGGFGALFVSDDSRVALVIPEVGDPILCVRA